MVNIDIHKAIFVNILREIYSDTLLRNSLGFKGGTAALLFYGLPRFSVDLDFDLLNEKNQEEIFQRLKQLLPQFGAVKEARIKHFTLFFLLNYQKGERNLKIEISKRPIKADFGPKNFLGISMLVAGKENMATSKLSALLTRKKFASRDLFDLWFFLDNRWQINEKSLKEKTGLTLKAALKKAQAKTKGVKDTDILQGLGELLDNKQKVWAKEKLKEELLFQLKLYAKTHQ